MKTTVKFREPVPESYLAFADWLVDGFAGDAPDDSERQALRIFLALLAERSALGNIRISPQELLGDFSSGTEGPVFEALSLLTSAGLTLFKKCPQIFHILKEGAVDRETPFLPVIVSADGRHFYLHKEYVFEKRLLAALSKKKSGATENQDSYSPENIFKKTSLSPRQEEAVRKSLRQAPFLLSGGPGTGKTHTVLAILRAHIEREQQSGRPVHAGFFSLAAPTGRAAHRLVESIQSSRKKEPYLKEVDELLPGKSTTLHRLLGLPFGGGAPAHGPEAPLPARMVVVDEASMIDLRLMTYLFESLGPETRLLLIGDKNQLPSVETGALFGSFLPEPGDHQHLFMESGVELRESFRSVPKISALAEAVNRMNDHAVVKELMNVRSDRFDGVPDNAACVWVNWPASEEARLALLEEAVSHFPFDRISELVLGPPATNWPDLLRIFDEWAILTPLHLGPAGSHALNALALESQRDSLSRRAKRRFSGVFVPGQPLLITRNDHALGLSNGDRGLVLWDEAEDSIFAAFPGGAHGGYRRVPLNRISEYAGGYAMTIHKSQGSEFEKVIVFLPPAAGGLLTKEIFYTAVTRAKQKVFVAADEDTLRDTTRRPVRRSSGVRDFLLGMDPDER